MVSEEQAEIGQVSTASDHCDDTGLGIDTQKARAAGREDLNLRHPAPKAGVLPGSET